MPASHRLNFEVTLLAWAAMRRRAQLARRGGQRGPTDVFLCIADHFEPRVGTGAVSAQLARSRLEDWLSRYPQIAQRHRDADGRRPAHTFFYPWDEYDELEMERLVAMCATGAGELELQLHHRDDTEDTLRAKIRAAIEAFAGHGALARWCDGRVAFGFVHGNWALDNSRHDGGRNYCGVNNEITVLQAEGCYADFTFPAWREQAQPRMVNQVYYAVDDPSRPKSHDRGVSARAGVTDAAGLLLIPGVLAPYLEQRGPVPRVCMDDSDLAFYRRFSPQRLDRWVRAGVHVAGRPDRVFIKLHCHGAEDRNRAALLDHDLDALFADAESRYNDGARYRLRYVTARELFNIVKATEAGVSDLTQARDYVLGPPAGRRTFASTPPGR